MHEHTTLTGKTKPPVGPVKKASDKLVTSWYGRLSEPRKLWGLIIGTSLVAAFLMSPHSMRYHELTVGEPSEDTIVSPITFQVVDEAATSKITDEVLSSVRPVYDYDDTVVEEMQERIDRAFNFMRDYLAAEEAHRAQQTEQPKDAETTRKDPKTAAAKSFQPLDDLTLKNRFENLLGTTVSMSSFLALKAIGFTGRTETELRSLVEPVLVKGVVLSREMVMREGKRGVLLRYKSKDKLEPLKDFSNVFDLKEAEAFVNAQDNDPARDHAVSRSIRRIATGLIHVNIAYNREKSAAVRQEALASVKQVYFQVAKGETIVKQGEPVNESHLRKLVGLNKALPAYSRYMILAGFALLLVLMLRLCFYFSEKHLDRARHVYADVLLVCVLLLGTIATVKLYSAFAPLIPSAGKGMNPRSILFAAPVASAAMLAALMVDARIAFIFSAIAALVASLSLEGDVYLFAFYFISGIVGLHGMTRITDRTAVLRAGLVVGLANMVSVLAIKMATAQLTNVHDFYETGLGFLGGVLSGLWVSGLAPLLEPLGYTTNIRLLELANLNHPLLRQMAMEAPGTYHHAIVVGNLAEAAAESIGANPLLARVGAYYHDVGKIGSKTKPYYFVENQARGPNPHDKLEPSMSALILVSHVKYGVEKAREYRLGAPIIDIIEQHHGSNLIKFFYNKALERADKDHHTVVEEKYRYPGPRPQTKEAALVMLADVVEAASRTMADPTPARIQKRVQELIMGLFNEGQLDQSTLTLKDLHAITRSFVRALQGIMHSRIDYPAEAQSQHHQEKTNGDPGRLQTDKDKHRQLRPQEDGGKNIRRLGL